MASPRPDESTAEFLRRTQPLGSGRSSEVGRPNEGVPKTVIDPPPAVELITVPGFGPWPVEPGETPEQALKRAEDTINADPRLRGQQMGEIQQRFQDTPMFQTGTAPDESKRKAFLASQLGTGVGFGELRDFGLRYQLARGDNAEEKMIILQQALDEGRLPEGTEFRVMNDPDYPDRRTILYRPPGQALFEELEGTPGVSHLFGTKGDLGTIAQGLTDPSVLGELAFTVFLRNPSVVKLMQRAGLGALAGDIVDHVLQEIHGFELSTTQDALIQSVYTGLFASAGTGVGAALGKLLQMPESAIDALERGKGFFPTPEKIGELERLMKAEPLLADRKILPGHIAPQLNTVQTQGAMITQIGQQTIDDIHETAVLRFTQLAGQLGDVNDIGEAQIAKFLNSQKEKLLKPFTKLPNNTEIADLAPKLQEGLNTINKLYYTRAEKLYSRARKASTRGVSFDVSEMKAIETQARTGVPFRFTDPTTGKKAVAAIPRTDIPEGPFGDAMILLRQSDDNVKTFSGTFRGVPFQSDSLGQMLAWRQMFWEMSNKQGLSKEQRTVARELYMATTRSLENPRGVQGARAKDLWRQGAAVLKERDAVFDNDIVRRLVGTQDPTVLAEQVFMPKWSNVLETTRDAFRKAGKTKVWNEAVDIWKADLINDPDKIITKLDAWRRRPKGLRNLLSSAEERRMRRLGFEWKKLQTGNLQKLIDDSAAAGEEALSMLGLGPRGGGRPGQPGAVMNKKEINAFLQEFGGRNSPQGKALAAGVVLGLVRRNSGTNIRLRKAFDIQGFKADLKRLDDRGIIDKIFTPSTIVRLRTFEKYIISLPDTADMGSSILAANINPKAFSPTEAKAKARMTISWLFFKGIVSGNPLPQGALGAQPSLRTRIRKAITPKRAGVTAGYLVNAIRELEKDAKVLSVGP